MNKLLEFNIIMKKPEKGGCNPNSKYTKDHPEKEISDIIILPNTGINMQRSTPKQSRKNK